MRWGTVEESHDRVAILGQGPSFADVSIEALREAREWDGVSLIAVNGAIDAVPFADYFFSLDLSNANLKRLRSPEYGTRYFAAVPPDYDRRGPVFDHVTYLRRIVREEPKRGPFQARVLKQIVGGLSGDPGSIHTGNSAFGALGLAYLMGAKRIGLFGVDGRGRKRWDGTSNGPLEHLPVLFRSAVDDLDLRGVEVRVGSPNSTVASFPRQPASEVLNWLVR